MDSHGQVPTREVRYPMMPLLPGARMTVPTPAAAPAMPGPRPASESMGGPAGASAWSMAPPGWPHPAEPPAGQSTHPAGLSGHPVGGYPGSGTRNGAGNRLVVIAVVVVIGIVTASVMVKVGYTAIHSGVFSGPVRPTIAPVPAAPASAASDPRNDETGPGEAQPADPGEAEPAGDPGGAQAAGAAGVSSRQPGVSPGVDRVYLTAMRQRPAFSGSADAELFGLGRSTCGQLDQGRSFMSVVTAGGVLGLQAEDMGYLTAISVMAYCPHHKPMLAKLIGQRLPSI